MQETVAARPQARKGQYLSFRLGSDDYAVDILRVQEIRGWEKVRTLPDSEDYVKGVLDLRGTIVPIIDLRVRFGNAHQLCHHVAIVMSVKTATAVIALVGAVVDAVSTYWISTVPSSNLHHRSAARLDVATSTAWFTLPRGMAILLNLDKFFDPAELGGLNDLVGE